MQGALEQLQPTVDDGGAAAHAAARVAVPTEARLHALSMRIQAFSLMDVSQALRPHVSGVVKVRVRVGGRV